jgi:hypothetical protein
LPSKNDHVINCMTFVGIILYSPFLCVSNRKSYSTALYINMTSRVYKKMCIF